MAEEYLGRWLFTDDGISPGCVRLRDGHLEEIISGPPPTLSTRSVVMPAFVNAHTHLGDSFAYPAPKGSVEEIVGPGGYKHRTLASATDDQKRAGMRSSMKLMWRTGTTSYIDFREEGLRGVSTLREAGASCRLRGVVLGRPVDESCSEDDLSALVDGCDGLAFSSVSDWPYDILEKASSICRRSGRLFALHASESRREDIETVLGLDPSFLVHMTAASEEDILACVDEQVPIVVCPRSNSAFGLSPDIPRLLRLGVDVALGTDNAMICEPNMISEMRAAYRSSAAKGGISGVDAIRLATSSGHKVLNPKRKITTELSTSDDLVVIDIQGEDPLLGLVSLDGPADVSVVIQDGTVRRNGVWTV
jgi:cytosine/adenosine deaminase-related metal-dependent hydrolase